MKIKITDCSDAMFWYSRHVGEIFDVQKISQDVFWCREPNEWGCLNIVLKKDCEVLKEED